MVGAYIIVTFHALHLHLIFIGMGLVYPLVLFHCKLNSRIAVLCNFPCDEDLSMIIFIGDGTMFRPMSSILTLSEQKDLLQRNFCDFSMLSNPKTEYLHRNGSCLKSCESPLTNKAEAGMVCICPCLVSEYLY